jgi:hypothetical protein
MLIANADCVIEMMRSANGGMDAIIAATAPME